MRPRHYAADNITVNSEPPMVQRIASMRPRHYAADNPVDSAQLGAVAGASMRPRHYAADNLMHRSCPLTRSASMRPRHYAADNVLLWGRSRRQMLQ